MCWLSGLCSCSQLLCLHNSVERCLGQLHPNVDGFDADQLLKASEAITLQMPGAHRDITVSIFNYDNDYVGKMYGDPRRLISPDS